MVGNIIFLVGIASVSPAVDAESSFLLAAMFAVLFTRSTVVAMRLRLCRNATQFIFKLLFIVRV